MDSVVWVISTPWSLMYTEEHFNSCNILSSIPTTVRIIHSVSIFKFYLAFLLFSRLQMRGIIMFSTVC